MPIREQGQRYQFIRNEYIPAHKDEDGANVPGKSVSRMVFSWKKNEEPGADDLLKLDKEERAELERWQEDMKKVRRKSYLNNCVSMLKRSLEDLAKSDSILEYLNDNEMSKIDDKIKRLRESRRRAKAKQRRNKS
jgi:hypothetical protein